MINLHNKYTVLYNNGYSTDKKTDTQLSYIYFRKEDVKMETRITRGMDKKAMFNAKNSSKNIKEIIGKTVEIVGYMVAMDIDKETGEVIKIGYLCLGDGTVYGFKSATLIDNVIDFDDYIGDEYGDEPFSEQIRVSAVKSKAGREFYQFNIV